MVTNVRMRTLPAEPDLPIASTSQMLPVRCPLLPFNSCLVAPPLMKCISYPVMGEEQKQASKLLQSMEKTRNEPE